MPFRIFRGSLKVFHKPVTGQEPFLLFLTGNRRSTKPNLALSLIMAHSLEYNIYSSLGIEKELHHFINFK